MINSSHTYSSPGTYTVRLVNTKNFSPVLKAKDFGISISDIENGSQEAKENLRFEALTHINEFSPDMDLEEFADTFDENYEEHYKADAEDNYIFNKYANIKITDVKPSPLTNTIKKYAYLNNFELKTVDLNHITTIEDFAFAGCSKLGSLNNDSYAYSTLVLPNTLKTIGRYAFAGCTSFKTIIIPKSVESIGFGAFYNCSNLKLVIFEDRSQEDVLDDFSDRFTYNIEDGSILNDIISSKGTIIFGSTVAEEELFEIINQLDAQNDEDNINITSDSYSDDPACPFENDNNININSINVASSSSSTLQIDPNYYNSKKITVYFNTIPMIVKDQNNNQRDITASNEIDYWKSVQEKLEKEYFEKTGNNVSVEYYTTATTSSISNCRVTNNKSGNIKLGINPVDIPPLNSDPTNIILSQEPKPTVVNPINVCSGVPIPNPDNSVTYIDQNGNQMIAATSIDALRQNPTILLNKIN